MSNPALLSRFTPSLMEPETLEAILVKRERLASLLVEHVRTSATTAAKHHALLVGPRGIGKTHLVSLVYHRVNRDPTLAGRLRVAWLREEEWGIASYADLLLAVCRAIGEEHGAAELTGQCGSLRGLSRQEAEDAAERLLLEYLGDAAILVIAENLDEIFRGLGDQGQHKLRALVHNHARFTLLATAQSLFSGVSLRTSPFYGFFEIHHLDELTFEEAVTLLVKIVEHRGDRALAGRLRTASGRARIRALHHLAGGNPRVYVIFSQFLSCESLDQLSGPVLQTLDDLTPYYQSRLGHLSAQQRKVVDYLCERRGAVTVTEIARDNFLTHQTASSQLRKLREFGYVRSAEVGRESFYELREPLMRLALDVKRSRGGYVRVFAEFLQVWYSENELHEQLQSHGEDPLFRHYVLQALEGVQRDRLDPRVKACLRDVVRDFLAEDYAATLSAIDDLLCVSGERLSVTGDTRIRLVKGFCLRQLGRDAEALDAFSSLLSGEECMDARARAVAQMGIVLVASRLGELNRATTAFRKFSQEVTSLPDPASPQESAVVWHTIRVALATFKQNVELLLRAPAAARASSLGSLMMDCTGSPIFFPALGWAIVETIPSVLDASVTLESAKRWLRDWQAAAADHDDLALPLRLLRAAVEYRENPDPRILLRLPAEERAILEALLPE